MPGALSYGEQATLSIFFHDVRGLSRKSLDLYTGFLTSTSEKKKWGNVRRLV